MTDRTNAFGQPIGAPLPDWSAPPVPARAPVDGRRCRLEPLDPDRHADALFAAHAAAPDDRAWTYLPAGPFDDADAHRTWVADAAARDGFRFFAVVTPEHGPCGVAAYLRIDPPNGVLEIGHLAFSPHLQRTPAATEALHLLIDHAFALGYRRVEWKCDSRNAPSRAAARRLGFAFEGVFRQAVVTRGRNRDTAWYALIDTEWPALRDVHRAWLTPENFDADGRQRTRLAERTAPLRAPDPQDRP